VPLDGGSLVELPSHAAGAPPIYISKAGVQYTLEQEPEPLYAAAPAQQLYQAYPSLSSLTVGMEALALEGPCGQGSGAHHHHHHLDGSLGYQPMPATHLGGQVQLVGPGVQQVQQVQVVSSHGHHGGAMHGRQQLVALAVRPGSSGAAASPELEHLGLALQGQGQLEQAVTLSMQLTNGQMGCVSNHLFTIQTMTAAQIRCALICAPLHPPARPHLWPPPAAAAAAAAGMPPGCSPRACRCAACPPRRSAPCAPGMSYLMITGSEGQVEQAKDMVATVLSQAG
jgi:hypothetical protein